MASGTGETVRFTVHGMHCDGCVSGINRALRERDGVLAQEVSLAEGAATVTYDPKAVSIAELKEIIEELGFEVA